MASILKKINSVLLMIQKSIVVVAGIVVCTVIVASAFMRYFLQIDFYGSEEIILFFAFWLYFMGSSLAAYDDSHINADMISSNLKSKKGKAIMAMIKNVLSLLISCIATVWSYNYILWTLSLGPKTNMLKWPLVVAQFPILVSFILMDFYILMHLFTAITDFKSAEKEGR